MRMPGFQWPGIRLGFRVQGYTPTKKKLPIRGQNLAGISESTCTYTYYIHVNSNVLAKAITTLRTAIGIKIGLGVFSYSYYNPACHYDVRSLQGSPQRPWRTSICGHHEGERRIQESRTPFHWHSATGPRDFTSES